MEDREESEKVAVPVRRREAIREEEPQEGLPEEPGEVRVWEVPRRWRVC